LPNALFEQRQSGCVRPPTSFDEEFQPCSPTLYLTVGRFVLLPTAPAPLRRSFCALRPKSGDLGSRSDWRIGDYPNRRRAIREFVPTAEFLLELHR
jgi:hypothetical protein